ncbi:hypothetical protein [Paenibacillus flagellatus]|uniref:Uncharacterized protein n=1 Tax=Paenibacillus flagellatus TaxID=2211139 RepID=A0A2V5K9G8_9BACL|nr:hypothetical protein [Paenibacillus flagellatus]PYI56139.1 hypothetical protein DLM86_03875 [Paenibacillus flagellatus]
MPYFLSYKGKKLGSPLSRHEAEEKLLVMSRCFQQLEIVKDSSQSAGAPAAVVPFAVGDKK